MKEYYIHWFIGQPGAGKTTLAKKLQFWLQTDKANWRKSVFHIDEEQIYDLYDIDINSPIEHKQVHKICETIAAYANSTDHDVVISTTSPYIEVREAFKKRYKVKEIYCHNNKVKDKLEYFEPPQQFFIDLDTTASSDDTFKKLIKILI